MKNDLLKNKFLYKITTIIVKYMPTATALWQIIIIGFNYVGISVPILGLIGGTSLFFLGLLYLLSYLFQYCSLYRFPLSYNAVVGILATLRVENLLPMDILIFYRLLMIITGIFILIFIYLIYKYRNHSKFGGIKQFCDKYLDCKF